MSGAPIRRIVVAGQGVVGWSAAAALVRKLRQVEVTLVASPGADESLCDRIGSTLPSIFGFHQDIGISETDVLARIGAGYRLGTRFEGWNVDRPAYVHGYGDVGQPFGTTSFHLNWVRSALAGNAAPFEKHSPAAALAAAERFVPPQPGTPLDGYEVGFQFDPARYRAMVRAYALHVGVREQAGMLAGVESGAKGVAALVLEDGTLVQGDLFIDCTGAAAKLRGKLGGKVEDWSRWLPCDRVAFAEDAPSADPSPLTQVAAHVAGWGWQTEAPTLLSRGLVYASTYLGGSAAAALLPNASRTIAVRSGRRSQPWLGNCVAVGDAAVEVEPLEWTNLHLAHSQIDRLIAKLPDCDFTPVELWDYNRETAAEADRVRDFLVMHYIIAARPEPMWRDLAATEPPASLAHTLALFRERGRLPLYEEETFTRHSWATVLLGQGVLPRRADPLTDALPLDQANAAMARMREQIAAAVGRMPSQGAYLRELARRAQA